MNVDSGIWLAGVRIRGDDFPNRDAYPFNVPALQGAQNLTFARSVAFFVGENGSGKSTLIEAMARRCGLHLWAQPRRTRSPAAARAGEAPPAGRTPPTGEAPPTGQAPPNAGTHSRGETPWKSDLAAGALCDYLQVTLSRAVKGGMFSAESFRQWAEFIDDVSEADPGQARFHGGERLTLRSRGEGLLAYFRGRYQVPGLYFLDEPEAALSPGSQLELLRLLSAYRRRGHAQFIIATHSPIVMAVPGAQVFVLGDGPVVETAYEATSHYRLYREFMADPSRFVTD